MPPLPAHPGFRRVRWAALLIIAGFGLLIAFVCYWYLLPAMQAVRDATPADRERLAAHARLVLAVLLFLVSLVMLFAGAAIAMRFSRRLFPTALPRQASSPVGVMGGKANHRIDFKPAEDR